MKSLLFLVSFLLAASVSLAAKAADAGDSRRELLDGGWQPINVSDRYVVEIAKFAVAAYNKNTHKHLLLLDVISGKKQFVSGVNYRLVFSADERSYLVRLGEYEATVWVNSGGDLKELTSFKRLKP